MWERGFKVGLEGKWVGWMMRETRKTVSQDCVELCQGKLVEVRRRHFDILGCGVTGVGHWAGRCFFVCLFVCFTVLVGG